MSHQIAIMDTSILVEFFAFVDADKDGFITVDEIKEACKVDIDGDGTISDDEKIQCARIWVNEKLPLQDFDGDGKISLAEMLAYAN